MSAAESEKDSERRQATVLFADISGFTAMAEKTDPEVVSAVMNRCFARLEQVVRDHGGYVDKFIGDAIMALFGVPTAIEEAPRQAVNAAIEMRRSLAQLNEGQHFPVQLDVHIGINSGVVLAGHVGGTMKREFTVVGDPVNLASRLTAAAPRGAIYVGPDTYRITANDFEYRELGRLRVKGRELPVPAWELLSSRERIHRARSERPTAPGLVGRERQLAEFRAYAADVARGRGGIVLLSGEAGIGKSRLVREVLEGVDAAAVTVLEGRSLSVGHGLRFHPFVDLLRQWTGIGEEQGERESLAALASAVERVVGDDAGEVLPFVATLMGWRPTDVHAERIAGIEGEAMETLITHSMRELFRRLAAARPLVLIFEDFHWADLSSQKLLEVLLGLLPDTPILFVLVMRPDPVPARVIEAVRRHPAGRLLEIQLGPLSTHECELLIRNLLNTEELPSAIRRIIGLKAEGNPFFIEEVIRSLVEQGVLETHQGALLVTANIDSAVIPGTIDELIMARVDRLAPQPRRLLQVASVIGRRFPYRILATVIGDEAPPVPGLAELTRSQLLEEARRGEELEYVFKHALIQETVYQSILQRTRKTLHVAVARSIEALFASRLSDFYGMLAYHYSRAEDLQKAEEYLFKAGDEAARSAAPSEALEYFCEASRLYFLIHGEGGDVRKKALLERNIAMALFHTGNLTESIEHFDEALALLGDPVPTSRLGVAASFGRDLVVLFWRLYAPRRLWRRRPATETDREPLQVRHNRARAQMTSDPRRYFVDSIGSLRRLSGIDPGGIDHVSGMYAGAGALFAYSGISFAISRRFLKLAEGLVAEGNIQDRFFYRSMQFVCDYLAGNWGDDRAIEEELVEVALRRGQVWDTFVYRGLNSERRAHRGDFAAAAREIERLKELSEAYGFVAARSNEYAMTAVLLVEQRQLDAAMRMVELYYVTQHEEVFHLFALATKAKIQVLANDLMGARATLARAEELARRMGRATVYHVSTFLSSRLLYDVEALAAALNGGDRGARLALARRARRSCRAASGIAAKVARERPEVYRLAGRLCWLLGSSQRALAWWTRSIAAGRALGARPELARTYAEVGLRLSEGDVRLGALDGVEASAYLELARGLSEKLGVPLDRAGPPLCAAG